MKNTILNLRISEELKNELDDLSFAKNKSVSDIVRDSISNYTRTQNVIEHSEHPNLMQTLGFAEFIFWIYDKRDNPEKSEVEDLYMKFIELINEMHSNELFNDDILIEMDKISKELKEYLNGTETDPDFIFSTQHKNGFDYEKFSNFMYCIRYADDELEQILFIK